MSYKPTLKRFYVRTSQDGQFSPTTLRRLLELVGMDPDGGYLPCTPVGPIVRVTSCIEDHPPFEGMLAFGPYGLSVHNQELPERVVTLMAFQVNLIEVIRPTSQLEVDAATAAYFKAKSDLVTAVEKRIVELVLEEYPNGTELELHGEYNEDGLVRLRPLRVKDDAGLIIAGLDEAEHHIGDDEDGEEWDAFWEDIESDLLNWLAELTDEDYLHDQTIFLVDPPQRPDPDLSPPCTEFTHASPRRAQT